MHTSRTLVGLLGVASLLSLGAVTLSSATGCSQPAKAKEGLPLCEEGDEKCSGESNAETPARSSSSRTGPTGAPQAPQAPADDTESTSSSPPAGSPEGSDAGGATPPAPGKQPSCVDLEACCAELEADGYDPSTCRGIVATDNNASCFNSLDRYRTYGECS